MFRSLANFSQDEQQENTEEFLLYLLNSIDNEMYASNSYALFIIKWVIY